MAAAAAPKPVLLGNAGFAFDAALEAPNALLDGTPKGGNDVAGVVLLVTPKRLGNAPPGLVTGLGTPLPCVEAPNRASFGGRACDAEVDRAAEEEGGAEGRAEEEEAGPEDCSRLAAAVAAGKPLSRWCKHATCK